MQRMLSYILIPLIPARMRARFTGLLAAFLICSTVQAADAQLIPGMPSIVYDRLNHVSAIARLAQLTQQVRGQIRQIEYAYDQSRQLREQARGWSNLRLSDFGGAVRQASRVMGEGVALGYGNPQLAELFRRHFPRVPRVSDGMPIPSADQMNSVRDLAYAAVMSSQMQGTQIDVAHQALDALRRNVVGRHDRSGSSPRPKRPSRPSRPSRIC